MPHFSRIEDFLKNPRNGEYAALYHDAADELKQKILANRAKFGVFKKLLCVLFDLALLKVYENASFFHFVYHDGVFEALDDRKKIALLDVIREQIASKKTQYILTLIESDMPRDSEGNKIAFDEDEIVLHLHDEGNEGRLFKMPEF